MFRVQDTRTRDIYVRCLAHRATNSGVPVEIRSGNQSGDIWSVRSQTFLGHAPDQDLFIGTLVAIPGAGGEAFNLLDVANMGSDYLVSLRGPGPAPTLLVIFNASNPNLSSTVGNTGASNFGLLLASALDDADPGKVIAVVVIADGADVLLFRTTDAIDSFTPARPDPPTSRHHPPSERRHPRAPRPRRPGGRRRPALCSP